MIWVFTGTVVHGYQGCRYECMCSVSVWFLPTVTKFNLLINSQNRFTHVLHPILANRLFLDLRRSNSAGTQYAVSGIIFAKVGTNEDLENQGKEPKEIPNA